MINHSLSGYRLLSRRNSLVGILLIIVAIMLSAYWLLNRPKAPRIAHQVNIPQVSIMPIQVINHRTRINVMGYVVASQSVNLTSRISGMVIETGQHFIEGGLVKKGEKIVQLDPTDFRLAVQQKKSELIQAEFNLKLEQGQQAIARREFQLLGAELSEQEKELVLRRPHLKAAKGKLLAAQANLRQAELNLQRTSVKAPFDAVILSRNANLGSWVSTFSTGTPLVKLAGTDSFWIDTSIPMNQLSWINIPGINDQPPSKAKITYPSAWGDGVYRQGVVKRLKAEVETSGRMAKLIIEVPDPLSLLSKNQSSPPLVLGTLVRVVIEGRILHNVVALPEHVLHDGQQLWFVDDSNQLVIKTVKSVWQEAGKVYLLKQQIPEGLSLIQSNLAEPVAGMQVQIISPTQSLEIK